MTDPAPAAGPRLAWHLSRKRSAEQGSRRVIYRGPLSGKHLRLHYGFDGWQGPVREVPLEPLPEGGYVAEIADLDGHLALDCAVTDGEQWDNNEEYDYRLWLTVDPFDAHLHVSGQNGGQLGLSSLQVALTSAGISGGIASFPGNQAVARATARTASLYALVWIRPGITPLSLVRRFLAGGFVGFK